MTRLLDLIARGLKIANWIMALAIAAAGSALFFSSLACNNIPTQPGTPLDRDDSLAVLAILKANGKAWPKTGAPVTRNGNGRVDYLGLYDMGLTTIPPDIGKLIAVTEINLSGNHLRRLPQEFEELTDLVRLNLSRNEFDSLPDGFTLGSLQELRLSHNRLTALPRNVDVTALRILDLDSNRIRALPPDFRYLGQLTNFYIQGNLLDSLPDTFGPAAHPGLKRLILADNNIASLPPAMKGFSLNYLNLARNRLCLPDTAKADSAQRALIDWLDASDRDWRATQRCP